MRWRLICLATFFIVDTFLDNRLEASSYLKTSDRIAAFFSEFMDVSPFSSANKVW